MAAGHIVLFVVTGGTGGDDSGLVTIPLGEIVDIRMTLHTGKLFFGLVDTPLIFP
jgi:hypothetical protein